MVRPVHSRFPRSQAFGSNPHWSHQLGIGHTGEDIAAPEGTPVVLVNDARIIFADWGYKMSRSMAARLGFVYGADGSGIQVCADHGDGIYTSYSHLSLTDMPGRGEWGRTGQVIGLVGNSGFSFGAHLHAEATRLHLVAQGFASRYGRFDPSEYYNRFPVIVPAASKPPERIYTEDEKFLLDLDLSIS